jgi:ribosomal protein S18 acetylase RimI-like enzyme
VDIRPYRPDDEAAVIAVWDRCGLLRPWNDPRKDIQRKFTDSPELFLVGTIEGRVVATVMAGYDGHRGWINYLGVCPDHQRQGLGREIMEAAERCLRERGVPKINLQVRSGNSHVIAFYESLGFRMDEVVSLGKRLESDTERAST